MTQATDRAPDELSDILRTLFTIIRSVHKGFESMSLDKGSLMVLGSIRQLGEIRPSASAQFCGLDISTISRHIKKLDEDGLIARNPDPADGRAHLMNLTAKGNALLDHAEELRRTELSAAIGGWSAKDRRTLGAILTRLSNDLMGSTERRTVSSHTTTD